MSASQRASQRQVPALLALRWQMVRSRRARIGFAALLVAIPLVMVAAVFVGVSITLPVDLETGLPAVLPTALAAFAILAFATPIAAGGGNELFPPAQLVAFPITVRTRYHWSLLLAPLNLGWFVQVAALLGLTALTLGDLTPRLPLGLLPVIAYLIFVSLLGQAFAWVVTGLRQTRTGRTGVWTALAATGSAVAALISTQGLTHVLDNLPTLRILGGAYEGYRGNLGQWSQLVLLLLLGSLLTYLAGFRGCSWALARVGDVGAQPEAQPLRRRTPARSLRSELNQVDRRSVWRAVPLRRGIALLAALPAALIAIAGLDWTSMILIPGIVAAGSALLFGINAFALDGGGATWLASLPLDPRMAYWSKVRVLAEVCAGTTAVVLLAGTLRAPQAPSAAQAAAVIGAALTSSAWVVASSMRLSVSRPHRADLRGPRDTPAPPGVMAVYSLRLAMATSLLGMMYMALSLNGSLASIAVATSGLALLSLRSLLANSRRYAAAGVRARVTASVSAG